MSLNANLLVSVIVPVFNMEKYLKRCLHSLNAQTYGEVEIIVVNDGSTDGSSTVIEDFRSISRFSLLVINQENLGLGAARNVGFRHAKGKYVAFVDSDDFVSPDLCQLTVKCAMDTQADIVEFGYLIVCSDHIDESPDSSTDAEIISKRKAIIGLSPMACAKLYSRELLLRAKLDFPSISHEDEAETFRIAIFADRIVRMQKKLYYYYKRADSIAGSVTARTVDLLRVAEILFDIAEKNPLYYSEFVYKSIVMLYRCRDMWKRVNEEWSNRALETALSRLKDMEPFEHDNPYFFVAKDVARQYQNSTSWRLTKPVRAVSQIVRAAFSKGHG